MCCIMPPHLMFSRGDILTYFTMPLHVGRPINTVMVMGTKSLSRMWTLVKLDTVCTKITHCGQPSRMISAMHSPWYYGRNDKISTWCLLHRAASQHYHLQICKDAEVICTTAFCTAEQLSQHVNSVASQLKGEVTFTMGDWWWFWWVAGLLPLGPDSWVHQQQHNQQQRSVECIMQCL